MSRETSFAWPVACNVWLGVLGSLESEPAEHNDQLNAGGEQQPVLERPARQLVHFAVPQVPVPVWSAKTNLWVGGALEPLDAGVREGEPFVAGVAVQPQRQGAFGRQQPEFP